MPSVYQPVETPPELDIRVPLEVEQQPGQTNIGAILGDVLALFLIVLGAAAIGFGVGTWVHPGAGCAATGIVAVVVGVLLGNRST